MGNETLILDLREIRTKAGLYILILSREDLSGVFPGLFRYNVSLITNGITVLVFRTNTFEYSPGSRHGAEAVSRNKMDEWDRIVQKDPGSLISPPVKRQSVNRPSSVADVVILQGSPRADGNCGLIAGWAADAARSAGKKVQVFFPHDMDLHFCIGCYQCFNSGTCTFNDDMTEILSAIGSAELVVICSPVYTNTVPAGLKTVFDRTLPYHASRILGKSEGRPKGLLFSVAGRKGRLKFYLYKACGEGIHGNIGDFACRRDPVR